MSHPRQLNTADLQLINAGAAAADNNVDVAVVPFDGFIVNIYKDQVGGPAGSAEIIDVHKNGTTIFSTATKITTAAGGTTRTYSPLSSMLVSAGDRLTMDIDQAGSGTPGEGVSVHIRVQRDRPLGDTTNLSPAQLAAYR